MAGVNQQIHPMDASGRITSGRYTGWTLTGRGSSKDGKGWFEGGRGQSNQAYLRFGAPEKPAPAAAPSGGGGHSAAPANNNAIPAVPTLPAPPGVPKPVLMPVPDDAAIRAAKERELARKMGRGRTSTIMTGSASNQLN